MYDSEVEVFRRQVQAFLASNLPSDWRGIGVLPADEAHAWVMDWRKILHRERYLAPGWPAEYGGGGMSALEQVILAEEFAKAGVPTGGPNDGFGITMLGNTLLTWGSEEQKKYYLPRILSNEDVWCQGYSEPNAGSDLGSLGLRATLDGDQWVLNGQKFGRRPDTWLITFSPWHEPTPTVRNIREFRSYLSICANPALKSDQSK